VVLVGPFQLQGTRTGFQRERGFGLAIAEVQMRIVPEHWLTGRWQIGDINQQTAMTGVLVVDAGNRYPCP
jgi:hypothetical protein